MYCFRTHLDSLLTHTSLTPHMCADWLRHAYSRRETSQAIVYRGLLCFGVWYPRTPSYAQRNSDCTLLVNITSERRFDYVSISCHVLSIGLLKSGLHIIWSCQIVDAVLVLISLHYRAFGYLCQVKISGYRAVLGSVMGCIIYLIQQYSRGENNVKSLILKGKMG